MENKMKGRICSTCRWLNNDGFCEKHKWFFPARTLILCDSWAICNTTIIKINKEEEE